VVRSDEDEETATTRARGRRAVQSGDAGHVQTLVRLVSELDHAVSAGETGDVHELLVVLV